MECKEEGTARTIGNLFVEILPDTPDQTSEPRFVQAFAVTVEPRSCGPLVKCLSSKLPLANKDLAVDLSHLKRVKRTLVDDEPKQDSSKKDGLSDLDPQASGKDQENHVKSSKRKRPAENRLDVILGAVSVLGQTDCEEQNCRAVLEEIGLSSYAATELKTVLVPARQAESKDEWKEFNSVWPMTFFPNQTKEFQEQAMQLSDEELEQMKHGMEAAIHDAIQCQRQLTASQTNCNAASCGSCIGTVVVSPETGKVVATAADEQSLQHSLLPEKCPPNPLSTSITLAIQGVSRLERQAAISAGGMQNENFRRGQYLCTGYDVYTTVEPTVYEAMALVHSRIRRLVFGYSFQGASQHAGLTKMKVHALPGTNHRYRAFMCQPGSDLSVRCRKLGAATTKPSD